MINHARPSGFLRMLGAFPVWRWVAFAAILSYATYQYILVQSSEEGILFWLFLMPMAAGSGLLASAREGKLDLLFGVGISRRHLYWTAFRGSVVLPLIFAIPLACLSVANPNIYKVVDAICRSIAIGLMTSGFCFVVGLVNPRYLLGVLWIAARMMFLLSRPTFEIYQKLTAVKMGGPLPPLGKLLLASLVFPEMMLQRQMPSVVIVASAMAGLIAVVAAGVAFERAELTGRRSQ